MVYQKAHYNFESYWVWERLALDWRAKELWLKLCPEISEEKKTNHFYLRTSAEAWVHPFEPQNSANKSKGNEKIRRVPVLCGEARNPLSAVFFSLNGVVIEVLKAFTRTILKCEEILPRIYWPGVHPIRDNSAFHHITR